MRKQRLALSLPLCLVLGLALTAVLKACLFSGHAIRLHESACESPGKKLPEGSIPSAEDVASDAFCAHHILQKAAPYGVVTVLGSARTKPSEKTYATARKFAFLWTKRFGDKYPIMTGGGRGIMEAANRGAKEADGVSIGFSTYFAKANETANEYTTHSYMFSSFTQREAELIDRAVALVALPGGFGTEWEIFEALSKIQTKHKHPAPLILLGSYTEWSSILERIRYFAKTNTINAADLRLIQISETPEKAVKMIASFLAKNPPLNSAGDQATITATK